MKLSGTRYRQLAATAGLIFCAPLMLAGTKSETARPENNPQYEVLYQFGSMAKDGVFPSQLIQASDGNLYGTTSAGGSYWDDSEGEFGYGTVFSLSLGLPSPLSSQVGHAMAIGSDAKLKGQHSEHHQPGTGHSRFRR